MFAKKRFVKYSFLTDFVLTKRRSFSQIIYFLKVSLLSFIFV